MDRAEYQTKLEELNSYVRDKDYESALPIVNEIDWKRVKSVRTLSTAAEVYEANKQYDDAKYVLKIALDRSPASRTILARLTEVSIKLGEIEDAEEYFEAFSKIAGSDNAKYLLQYKLYKAKREPITSQIEVLKEYREREYTEEWAYELASLYAKAGDEKACVQECDDMILWFGEGNYVLRALELKMRYEGLTPAQRKLYNEETARESGEINPAPAPAEEADPADYADDPDKMKGKLRESFEEVFQGIRREPPKEKEDAAGKIDNTIPLEELHISDLEPERPDTTVVETPQSAETFVSVPEPKPAPEKPKEEQEEIKVWTDIGINKKKPEEELDENAVKEFDLDSLLKETAGAFSREISSGEFEKTTDDDYLTGIPDLESEEQLEVSFDEAVLQRHEPQKEASFRIPETEEEVLSAPETAMEELFAENAEVTEERTVEPAAEYKAEPEAAEELSEPEAAETAAGPEMAEAEPAAEPKTAGTADEPETDDMDGLFEAVSTDASGSLPEVTVEAEPAPAPEPVKKYSAFAESIRRAVEEQEAQRKIRQAEEEKRRLEEERRAKEEAEQRAREEAERRAREEAEAAERARIAAEEARKKAREEAERKAREEAEAAERARIEAEEAERRAREEAERKAREEAEAAERARIEAEEAERARIAAEEAERARIAAEEAERARIEAEEAEKRAQEEEARKAQEEAERMAHEEAEAIEQARLELQQAEEAAKAEEEAAAREEAEKKAREEAEAAALAEAVAAYDERMRAEEEAGIAVPAKAAADTAAETGTAVETEAKTEAKTEAEAAEAAAETASDGEISEPAEETASETEASEPAGETEPEAEASEPAGETEPETEASEAAGETEPETEASEAAQETTETSAEEKLPESQKPRYNEELEVPDPEPTAKERLSHSRTLDLNKVGENTVPVSLDEIISSETPEERRIRILHNEEQLRMNDDQRRIFTYFARIPGMDHQILSAMTAVYQHADEHTSSHGNLAVMGAQGSGKSRLATNLISAMCLDLGMEAAKIARITGFEMNKKDPAAIVKKMAGGFLLIEECSEMTEETTARLGQAMDFKTDRMILIVEDEKAAMRGFLRKNPEFSKKIEKVISIPIFTNDELITFARSYAEENGCKLDDMAVLALYTIIGNNQSYESPMTISKVKTMIDEAITQAQKSPKRSRRGRRRGKDAGLLVLQEKDFE